MIGYRYIGIRVGMSRPSQVGTRVWILVVAAGAVSIVGGWERLRSFAAVRAAKDDINSSQGLILYATVSVGRLRYTRSHLMVLCLAG